VEDPTDAPVDAPEVNEGTLPVHPEDPVEASAAKPANGRAEQVAQATVLAVVFAVPALMCAHAACVVDADIW
jgi:hypothetical protein